MDIFLAVCGILIKYWIFFWYFGNRFINYSDKLILKWYFGFGYFVLDWKVLCDLEYENIVEKLDEVMVFYI